MGRTQALSNKTAAKVNTSVAAAAKRLFDSVTIVDVRLVDCRAYLRGGVPEHLVLTIGRNASGFRFPDRRQTCARVRFVLEGRPKNDDGKDPTLFIEATFNAVYNVPEDLEADDEALQLFAHTNGTFNLWPYWREFVHTMANRMGVPGLTVPTYRIEEAFSGPGSADRPQRERTPRTKRK